MRDARLAELAFLSTLNEEGEQAIVLHGRRVTIGSTQLREAYGLQFHEFKEMLFHLLIDSLVNGPARITFHPAMGGTMISPHPDNEIRALLRGDAVPFKINHKGRVRLWSLKDELLSKRHLEPHGILLSEQYCERDWEIAWLFQEKGRPISLLYCDMDHFKQVNALGHAQGDQVMKAYLSIVRNEATGIGEAYRGVGDEVTVILPNLDEPKGKQVAESIRHKVEKEMKALPVLEGHTPLPTVSIGGATFPATIDSHTAFKFVDALLMKEAKVGAKNAVAFKTYA